MEGGHRAKAIRDHRGFKLDYPLKLVYPTLRAFKGRKKDDDLLHGIKVGVGEKQKSGGKKKKKKHPKKKTPNIGNSRRSYIV